MEGHGAPSRRADRVERSAEWNYRTGDVRVPEGWLGWVARAEDDEKPVHRVWVDAFELAAYQ